ncbi:MAG: hypothetical protein ACRED4_03695, partial [Brevundimonas sp.]
MLKMMLAALGRVRTSVHGGLIALVLVLVTLGGAVTPVAAQSVSLPVYNSGAVTTTDGVSWALVDFSPSLSRSGITAYVSYVSFLIPGNQKYLNA